MLCNVRECQYIVACCFLGLSYKIMQIKKELQGQSGAIQFLVYPSYWRQHSFLPSASAVEVMESVIFVRLYVRVCGTYIAHHCNGTDYNMLSTINLGCAPQTCVVLWVCVSIMAKRLSQGSVQRGMWEVHQHWGCFHFL